MQGKILGKNYRIQDFWSFLKINLSNFTLIESTLIKYYWIPRVLVSIIIILFYKKFHMPGEDIYSPSNPFQIPDINTYSSQNSFNFLYSTTYQILSKIKLGIFLKLIAGELISAYSCINLTKNFFKLINYKDLLWFNLSIFFIGIVTGLSLFGFIHFPAVKSSIIPFKLDMWFNLMKT